MMAVMALSVWRNKHFLRDKKKTLKNRNATTLLVAGSAGKWGLALVVRRSSASAGRNKNLRFYCFVVWILIFLSVLVFWFFKQSQTALKGIKNSLFIWRRNFCWGGIKDRCRLASVRRRGKIFFFKASKPLRIVCACFATFMRRQ